MIILKHVLVIAAILMAELTLGTATVAAQDADVRAGIAAGVLGAVAVALSTGIIADAVQGMGQELFNATVLFAAVAMIAWHAIWMATHGRALAVQMKTLGSAVSVGRRPLTALLIVVALAMLREGSEVVLFLFAQAAGGSQ